MDPQHNGPVSPRDENSDPTENNTAVSEQHSEDSNVFSDTVSQPGRSSNIVWPYSPISTSSDGYNPQISVKSEFTNYGDTSVHHKAGLSEMYQYSNVPYHDYANIYQSQYPEWQQMQQWYYSSNFYGSDHSTKYPTTDIPTTLPPPDSMNDAQQTLQTTDISRCSTPDLISALAAIPSEPNVKFPKSISPLLSEANQVLSNESPKLDISPNVSVISEQGNHSLYLQVANRVQDSGYNSDLCMSPVYPFDSKLNSPLEELKSDNSDEEIKENIDPDGDPTMNLSHFIDLYNTTKPYMPKPSLTDLLKDSPTSDQDDIPTQNSDVVVQSTDITSSSISSPAEQKQQPKPILCHKMPQQPQKPNIKKCEAAKRKISDAEIQAVMHQESRRQRHNQPLNLKAVRTMTEWYDTHEENPYPSKSEKEVMAKEGGISVTQVKSWFANKRNRSNNTKPKVQKRQMTERLLDICHQLARTAKQPTTNNADIIQQLSTIFTSPQSQ